MKNFPRSLFAISSSISIILNLLISYFSLSEWYRVGILENRGGYPFGGEGPVPYYYKSAGLYGDLCVGLGG